MAATLGIGRIATPVAAPPSPAVVPAAADARSKGRSSCCNIIHRVFPKPHAPAGCPYVVAAPGIDEMGGEADIIPARDFRRARDRLKKGAKRGMGFEMLVADARRQDATGVARWFAQARDLHSFCRSTRCQFILSSGATNALEMVSGQSFDAILRNCGIDPQAHWEEMEGWLESRLSRRVIIRRT